MIQYVFSLDLDQVKLIHFFGFFGLSRVYHNAEQKLLDQLNLIQIQSKNIKSTLVDPNPEYKILDQHYLIQLQSQNITSTPLDTK